MNEEQYRIKQAQEIASWQAYQKFKAQYDKKHQRPPHKPIKDYTVRK